MSNFFSSFFLNHTACCPVYILHRRLGVPKTESQNETGIQTPPFNDLSAKSSKVSLKYKTVPNLDKCLNMQSNTIIFSLTLSSLSQTHVRIEVNQL